MKSHATFEEIKPSYTSDIAESFMSHEDTCIIAEVWQGAGDLGEYVFNDFLYEMGIEQELPDPLPLIEKRLQQIGVSDENLMHFTSIFRDHYRDASPKDFLTDCKEALTETHGNDSRAWALLMTEAPWNNVIIKDDIEELIESIPRHGFDMWRLKELAGKYGDATDRLAAENISNIIEILIDDEILTMVYGNQMVSASQLQVILANMPNLPSA